MTVEEESAVGETAGGMRWRERVELMLRNPSLRMSKILLGAAVLFVSALVVYAAITEVTWT